MIITQGLKNADRQMPYFAIGDYEYYNQICNKHLPITMDSQPETTARRHQRIIMFPVPFQGHINPMFQLANLLYSKGFSITILHTNFNAPKTSNYPHFTFKSILDNGHENERFSQSSLADFAQNFLFKQDAAEAFRDELELLLASVQDEQVSCLITDALWHFTQSVADSLNLPRLVLRTGSLYSTIVYSSIPLLDDRGYFKLDDSHLEEQVSEFPLLKVKDVKKIGIKSSKDPLAQLLGDMMKQIKASSGIIWNSFKELEETELERVPDDFPIPRFLITFPKYFTASSSSLLEQDQTIFPWLDHVCEDSEEQVVEFPLLKVKDVKKIGIKSTKDLYAELIGNMVKQTKASSGIIWNSFKELEETELDRVPDDFPVPRFLILFPKYFKASSSSLQEQDQTIFPWLDQQPTKSVVYVSFGSLSQVEEKEFLEIAHGLVYSKQPFLWVVRMGFVKNSTWLESLPEGFPGERGRVVEWAPQHEVLAHEATGVFWTHSGWNSTMESICEGVPMICSSFWGDQPLDARYMSDVSRVGVYLENGLQREDIASVIRRILVDEEGEEIRERAQVLKQKADESVMKGGASSESVETLVDYISSL
uniref:Putative UDP-glucuronosyl/UDP-glucosyltransferase n=1 Tax=Helianthus annuus TaxID=4232 RepID=A0A251UDX1_HELAN